LYPQRKRAIIEWETWGDGHENSRGWAAVALEMRGTDSDFGFQLKVKITDSFSDIGINLIMAKEQKKNIGILVSSLHAVGN